ncbi:MAG: LpqB family beta-propeller domain-containing protein [Betaproteobacteria bacterium]|jgi:acetyl esterase/lipase|nr:LpqB family beta-propeller domain-containing protein [Rubrivivax sp.]
MTASRARCPVAFALPPGALLPALVLSLTLALMPGRPAAATPAPPAAAAPTVRDIALEQVRQAALRSLRVSPNGKRAAMIVAARNGRHVVAVVDLPPTAPARTVGGFSNADVASVTWISDDRLAYEAYESGTEISLASTMAVDADGRDERELINWSGGDSEATTSTRRRVSRLPYGWYLAGSPRDGSPDVYVEHLIFEGNGDFVETRLARLDTLTGDLKPMSLGVPDRVVARVLDAQGRIHVVLTTSGGRSRLQHRQPDGSWQVLEDHDAFSDDVLVPRYLEADGTLIVSTRRGHDTIGLYAYDLTRRKLDPEPLLRVARFDVDDALEIDAPSRRVIGANLVTDVPQTIWFSPRMAAIQQTIDATLPAGRINVIGCTRCETARWYAVWSGSDRHPGEYLLYDHQERRHYRLGAERPWLAEASQGARSFHRATARDGLSLPLVMTHPPGRDKPAALPAVVLVHGGPWVRGGSRQWSADAQFLARRGWRVLEVEFRGSTGFGARHLRAGWKQWGQAMQDDLADAVQWAAREGWIDIQRVCIAGASYGGYAALMGTVRHPELYRCAASHVGVTDLQLMFSTARSDLTHQARRYTMPQLVGDPVADAEMLRRHSPVARVADIKVPVLLAHGSLDRRVPREHANRFEAAARRAGVAIERVDYAEEGHGFMNPENHADYLTRLDAFIARAIGRAD